MCTDFCLLFRHSLDSCSSLFDDTKHLKGCRTITPVSKQVWSSLSRRRSDVLVLQVEPFLLAPQGANLRERGRRKELLRQRRVHLNLGVLEEDLPVQLQLSYIK